MAELWFRMQQLTQETKRLQTPKLQTKVKYYDKTFGQDLHEIVRQLAKEMDFLLSMTNLKILNGAQHPANTEMLTMFGFNVRLNTLTFADALMHPPHFVVLHSPRVSNVYFEIWLLSDTPQWNYFEKECLPYRQQLSHITTMSFNYGSDYQLVLQMIPKYVELFSNLKTVDFVKNYHGDVVCSFNVQEYL